MFVLFHLAIIFIFYLRLLVTPLLPLWYLQTFILYVVSSFYLLKKYIRHYQLLKCNLINILNKFESF